MTTTTTGELRKYMSERAMDFGTGTAPSSVAGCPLIPAFGMSRSARLLIPQIRNPPMCGAPGAGRMASIDAHGARNSNIWLSPDRFDYSVFEVTVKERLFVEEVRADSSPPEMETEKPFNPSDYGYTVYEKREYPQIIYKIDYEQSWIDIAASCYRGAQLLIEGVAKGSFGEDIRGCCGPPAFPSLP